MRLWLAKVTTGDAVDNGSAEVVGDASRSVDSTATVNVVPETAVTSTISLVDRLVVQDQAVWASARKACNGRDDDRPGGVADGVSQRCPLGGG